MALGGGGLRLTGTRCVVLDWKMVTSNTNSIALLQCSRPSKVRGPVAQTKTWV